MVIQVNPITDLGLAIDIMPVFQEGGKLAVVGGRAVVDPSVRILKKFPLYRRHATQDKHKKGSISIHTSYVDVPPNTLITLPFVLERIGRGGSHMFIAPGALFDLQDVYINLNKQQSGYMAWVEHGFEDDVQTEICQEIHDAGIAHIEVKAFDDPRTDSNSVFRDALGKSRGYGEDLAANGVRRIFMFGLAEDYCVGLSALDARAMGFEVFVVVDATAPVDFPAGNAERMRQAMREAGVQFIREADIVA